MKTAMEWTVLILALSLIVQTLEFIVLRKSFSEKGIWRWSEIRREHSYLRFFDWVLKDNSFLVLLWLRLAFSVLLLFQFSFPVVFFLFVSNLLITNRFRGTFNGGSDYMTAIVLSALSVGAFFQTEKVLTGVLWYIALQAMLSYFLAGLVKIRMADWRSGAALRAFLNAPNYNAPLVIRQLVQNKTIALSASWTVMAGQILFPIFVFLPETTGAAIALAFLFHLNNVWLFGLNRFLLAWSATYPAVYFVAKSFSNSP